MNWFRDFSLLEAVFIGLFALLYLLFIFRIRRLARFFNRGGYLVWVKFVLRTVYFGLLLVALLGPSFGDTKKEIKSVGRDVYLAIDLSRSMDATDLLPSRLQKVKFELGRLVQELHSDRIGLLVFSSEAYVQCPLTYDQSALQLFIGTLSTSLLPQGGTDLGSAIELAQRKLKPEKMSQPGHFAKALVLVTDGEDFGERTGPLALKLARAGISLFVLGVGTEAGGNIPEGSRLKKDQDGHEVLTQLDSERLRQLTRTAGGSYFELSNTRNDVPRLASAISRLQGNVRATRTLDVAANKYMYPLVAALLLIAADVLLTLTIIKV